MMRTRFEYTVLDIPSKGFWTGGEINHEALSIKLNELGSEGWEVVGTESTNMHQGVSRGLIIILKREIV